MRVGGSVGGEEATGVSEDMIAPLGSSWLEKEYLARKYGYACGRFLPDFHYSPSRLSD